MIISEKIKPLVDEFSEQGDLSNNIKLLHFGQILLHRMIASDCTLDEILHAINLASQKQIKLYDLGRAIL